MAALARMPASEIHTQQGLQLVDCIMAMPLAVPAELLRNACARHRIPPGDEFLVLNALRNKGAPMACCGSDCRPCVVDVEAAANELRSTLGWG